MAACDFVQVSHTIVPQRKSDFDSMKMPITIAFTPFPGSSKTAELLPYPHQRAPQCRHCQAFATGNYLRSRDRNQWICACCLTTNRFINFVDFDGTTQAQAAAYDVYFESELDKDKKSVDFRPMKVVFLLEKSQLTLTTGLFSAVLNLVRRTAKECETRITLVVFDKTVHVPLISSDRKRYSITSLIEPDYLAMPREQSVLFSMPEELELFESYLSTVESDSSVRPIRFSLMNMLDSIGPLLVNDAVPVVFSCQAEVGDFSRLVRPYVEKSISVHLNVLFCDKCRVDTSCLADFLMETNSKLRTFGEEQLPNLERWKCPRGIRRPLASIHFANHFLTLKDVVGCGLRTTHRQFALTSMSENDTIYFFFEYQRDLKFNERPLESLVFQCQVRYFDRTGCCVFRTITATLHINSNQSLAVVCSNMSDTLFLASSFLLALNNARELHKAAALFQCIETVKKNQLNNESVWPRHMTCIANMKIHHALYQMNSQFAPWIQCAQLLGRSPDEIVTFFCPMAYKMLLGSDQVIGPYTLSGYQITTGALCFNIDSEQAVIYVSDVDHVDQWMSALQSPPLYDTIAQVCQSRSVYVLSRATPPTHPLHRFVWSHMHAKPQP